jgi:hypothetical protein
LGLLQSDGYVFFYSSSLVLVLTISIGMSGER